jgi:hypothetical protein
MNRRRRRRELEHIRDTFLIGVGVGVLTSEYGGDLVKGILAAMEEQRIKADLERRRIVDVMGDTVGYWPPGVGS